MSDGPLDQGIDALLGSEDYVIPRNEQEGIWQKMEFLSCFCFRSMRLGSIPGQIGQQAVDGSNGIGEPRYR